MAGKVEVENLEEESRVVKEMKEHDSLRDREAVDDEPGAHQEHRRISRYGRSSHRFNKTMKGSRQ